MNEEKKRMRRQREQRLRELFNNKRKITFYEELESEEDRASQKFRETYRGQSLFIDCFTDHYLETLDSVLNSLCPENPNLVSSSYGYFVSFHLDQFKSMRSAMILAVSGYPLQGYSLLRNVYEESIFMSAILQKITTISEMQGLIEGGGNDAAQIKKRRKSSQLAVMKKMSGNASCLTEKSRGEIERWDNLFDLEIHGSRLSKTEQIAWVKGEKKVHNILPQRIESSDAMMLNRYNENAWMLLRLLPMLQIGPYEFSMEWKQKWEALEVWLNVAVNSLTTELNKPIGAAMADLVNTKFPFKADSSFPLRQ